MSEPLSELAGMIGGTYIETGDGHRRAATLIGQIGAEIDRLRAENAAMRPIVEAVAEDRVSIYDENSEDDPRWKRCAACDGGIGDAEALDAQYRSMVHKFERNRQEEEEIYKKREDAFECGIIVHTPDCPVTQARALLAKEGGEG